MRSPVVIRFLFVCLAISAAVVVQSSIPFALAQSNGAIAAGPAERMLVVPHLGDASARAKAAASDQVLRVQNGGQRTTRVLLIASYAPGGASSDMPPADDCPSCPSAMAVCSAPLKPGYVAALPLGTQALVDSGLPQTAEVQSVVILSLNTRPASDYGPQWTGAAELLELPGDASIADVVCARARKPLAGPECPSPWALISQFAKPPIASDSVWQGLPAAPMWGEPIAAVAAVPSKPLAVGQIGLDRYRALPYNEVWNADPSRDETPEPTYYLPGAYLRTVDLMNSTVVLANPGTTCAHATLSAYRTGGSRLTGEVKVTVPPGASLRVVPGDTWESRSTAALRVVSDRPLGTAMLNIGYSTTSVHTGVAARSSAVEWAIPRAYQEWRPVPGSSSTAGAADRRRGRSEPPVAQQPVPLDLAQSAVWSEAWETNISIFNALGAQRLITMYQYAEAKPPRPPVAYPFEPWQQWVFQPGFGQGYPGGPGWARYETGEAAAYLVAESLREAADSLQWIEGWSTAAWPRDPGAPRAIALPDLGGPAAGRPAPSTSPTKRPLHRAGAQAVPHTLVMAAAAAERADGMPFTAVAQAAPSSLAGRVAIENLGAMPADIVLDTYGDACGYTGSITETIDPYQTVTYLVADLPGVTAGANAAIVRVMAGEVAVLAEQTQPALQPVKTAAPDVSSAYLGTPLALALAAPALPLARLGVSTNAYTITLPQAAPATINVEDAASSGRCLSFEVTADVPWLAVAPATGDIPGLFEVTVRTAALGPEARHVGHVTVRAREPNVAASPRVIPITVLGRGDGGAKLFLPALRRGPLE